MAEHWGRRWITIDISRVALTIARQRIMTAKYDYYRLRDKDNGPAGNFFYKEVPHITLESIARNTGLDAIFARHEPIIAKLLAALNAALATVPAELAFGLKRNYSRRERLKIRMIRQPTPTRGVIFSRQSFGKSGRFPSTPIRIGLGRCKTL